MEGNHSHKLRVPLHMERSRPGPQPVLRSLATLCGIVALAWASAQPCLTGWNVTTSTPPVNGTYACGQTVTFCLNVTSWNQTNANWFHGVVATWGPGWDLSTLVPSPPPATCGTSNGTWGWYNSVQGTSFFTNVGPQGPGFFFDLNNDGNAGNNFGDNCTGPWQFCWTISVLDGPACVNGTSLSVSFNTFSDSQTGSWSGSGCTNDPLVPGPPAVIAACNVSAGTDGNLTLCSTSDPGVLFAALGGNPDGGGEWTGPGGTPSTGIFVPGISVPGAYTYTVTSTAPPCTAQAVVTVSVVDQPDAGSDGAITVCASDTPFGLIDVLLGSPDAGGVWTRPDGSAMNGTFNPALDPAGTYTYTLDVPSPCVPVSSSVTVTVNPTPTAGADATVTVCSNGTPLDLFAALGGNPDVGGTWTAPDGSAFAGTYTPGQGTPGAHVYSVPGTPPCPASSATVTVVENPQPDAGANATAELCQTAGATALIGLLGGTPDAGGSWTGPGGSVVPDVLVPSSAASGTYTYTVIGAAPCVDATADVAITIQVQSTAGVDGTLALCTSSAAVQLISALGGSPDSGGTWAGPGGPAGPTFTPGTSLPGTYTYSVPSLAPCTTATAQVVVTVGDQPNAGTSATVALCSAPTTPFDLLSGLGGTPDAGGTWTGPTGAAHGPSFVPGTDDPGTYTYTLTAAAPCTTATSTVDVNIVPAPNAGSAAAVVLCADEAVLDPFIWLTGDPDTGGTWSAPNGSPVTSVDPASAASGNYTYTVSGTPPCANAQTVVAVTISPLPLAGTDGVLEGCSDGASTNLFSLLGPGAQPGGTWSGPSGAFNGTFIPGSSPSGSYTYVVNGTGGCIGRVDSAQVDVTVFPLPVPAFTVDPAQGCAPLTVLLTNTTGTPLQSATWDLGDGSTSALPGGLSHVYTQGGSYTVSLTVTDANGCTASVTQPGAVFVSNGPSAAFSASPFELSLDRPVVDITHAPLDGVVYAWSLDDEPIAGGGTFSQRIDPPTLGDHTICLVATDSLGCSNESCFTVRIVDNLTIHVPNAFTPDGDGINDVFGPVVLSAAEGTYEFMVFDRWGQEVFATKDLQEQWNGTYRNGGEVLPIGVYVWRLVAQDQFTADRKELIGSVTLLK